MYELNKCYEKAAKIILNPNYGFNETSKRIASAYLNQNLNLQGLSDFDVGVFWDGMFNEVINYKYILSVPMRVKASILSECTFLKGFNKLLF